jgi:hypothetical protein
MLDILQDTTHVQQIKKSGKTNPNNINYIIQPESNITPETM